MSQKPDNGHSTWSASATTRNWNCMGALALTQQVAHLDKESEAAGWGTACHTISEDCLRTGRDAEEWVDRTVKTKAHEFVVDEEMSECAQEYIDYVRRRLDVEEGTFDQTEPKLLIEQRFSLKSLKPPFDAGGTADAVVIDTDARLLEVIDLKGGRGVVVEVADNKQLKTYALGAMLANPGIDVTRIKSTIVQPRAGHKDGAIRSETYHVMDLAEWTGELRAAMERSKQACDAHANITGDISREVWAAKYLLAGGHCTFCPAAGMCPALEKKALDAAGVWFDDQGTPQLSNTPSDLSPEKLTAVLDAADLIQGYLNACRQLAHSLAESGVEFKDYHLVDRIGRRKWKLEEEALAAEMFLSLDVTVEELYVPKLRSPAQLEKVLGTKRKASLQKFIEIPVTGTNLVRKDKSTRKAVAPAVHKHFTAIN